MATAIISSFPHLGECAMQTLLNAANRKAAPRKSAKKSPEEKVSAYDKGQANGWGFLLRTLSKDTIKKLKGR